MHVLNGSNSDVAYDMNGQMRFVRRFNAATGRYEVLGDVGRSYFRTHRSRFNAAIPVKRLVRKEVPRGSGNWQYVETNNGDVYKYITDEQIQEFLMGVPGVNLADLMLAPAEATPDQQREWISEAVQTYLQQMPRIGSGQWHQLTEFDDSSCIYVWDPEGELRFDEEISHVRDDGALAVQTILNRPLRGIVVVPDEMYGKIGIHPVAWEEALPGENCVLNMLVLGITKRTDTRVRNRQTINGRKVTIKDAELEVDFEESYVNEYLQKSTQRETQKYTLEEMAKKVEECFEQLYPLEEPTEEQKQIYPEKTLIRRHPYENGEWRNVGITAEIVKKICEQEKIAVHILHSDRLIQSCYPEGWKPGGNCACLCFNIWSDHGFLYDGSTQEGHNVKVGISKMRPLAPAVDPGIRLSMPGDEDERLNYEEMSPYSKEAFEQALNQGTARIFYVDGSENNTLDMVMTDCEEKKLQFRQCFGKSPTVPSSVHIYFQQREARGDTHVSRGKEEAVAGTAKVREKKAIKIRVLPEQHRQLNALCEEFHKLTGLKMEYKGEPMASLADRMLQQLLVTKRKEASSDVKKAIWERQGHACAACGTKLDKRSHLDHKQPLHEGGSNEPENLQYLCRECHETKTQQEEMARGASYHPLQSSMSPHMYETFCKMPKPLALSGRWGALKQGQESVRCVDVRGCRTNALLEYQWDLPTFSPLDDWEEYLDEEGVPRRPLDQYDFFYVDIPDVDLCDPSTADFYFPYTGARAYCLGSVDYMLRKGIICNDNIVYAVRASRHLSPARLDEAFKTIDEAIKKVSVIITKTDVYQLDRDFPKLLRLGWIGLCQVTERLEWHVVKSMYVSDAPGNVSRREYLGHGVWNFKSCTHIVDLHTMRPYGEIALQMEQVFVHQAMELMKKVPRAMTLGVHVDGLFVRLQRDESKDVYNQLMDAAVYPSGQKMFHEKFVPAKSFPTWRRRYEDRSFQMDLRSITWRHLNESDAGDQDPQEFFVEQILANKGGLMNCLGGTGKTRVIQMLTKRLCETAKDSGTNLRVVVMSMRHAAKAQLSNGQTIAHVKHKYAKAQNVFYIVDEAGELGAGALEELARYKLVGCNFLLCGDWDGQLLPMFDRWGDVYNERGVLQSHLMHSMANGLSLKLTKCRRTLKDQAHFELVRALYEKSYFRPGEPVDEALFKEELQRTLTAYMQIFPVKIRQHRCAGVPDCVAVISHRHRLLMNALINLQLSQAHEDKKWLPWLKEDIAGATMQPQSCYVWPGLEVCGCTRGLQSRASGERPHLHHQGLRSHRSDAGHASGLQQGPLG